MRIPDILNMARKFELEGFNFYTTKSNEARYILTKEILNFLAEMEKEHVDFIERLMEEGKIEEEDVQLDRTENFYEDRFKSQKLDEITPEGALADLSILRMAHLIEKDFVNFYGKAAENSEDEKSRGLFNMLKKWEESHLRLVDDMIKLIYEKSRLDIGFYPVD